MHIPILRWAALILKYGMSQNASKEPYNEVICSEPIQPDSDFHKPGHYFYNTVQFILNY